MKPSLSFSEFSLALQCLQKYKLIAIDKLKSGTDDSADVSFGSAVHAGIKAYLEEGDGKEVFDIYWESLREKPMVYSRYKWDELSRIGGKLLERFEKKHVPKLKPVHMEQRLYADYKGIKVEGTADFLGTYDGVPVLLDWKTAAYRYQDQKLDTSLQLNLYSYLGITCLGFTPKQIGYLVFVKGTETLQGPTLLDFSSQKMYAILDQMVDYKEKMSHGGTYPKNPNACIMGTSVCTFIDRCWKQ